MQKQPNVLWICADQMRAQAMSHRGDPNVSTPHLDRFAAEGVSFINAISGAPLCTPFRGSLITGKYPNRSGVAGLDDPLPVSNETIGYAFKERGYRTCWIGKWHLDGKRPELDLNDPLNHTRRRYIPPERRAGFDDWWAYENNNRPFDCFIHTDEKGDKRSYKLPGYETDSLTELLIEWLQEQKRLQQTESGKPFFACLSVQPPHDPYTAPSENMRNYNPAELKLRPNVPNVGRIIEQSRRELAGYYAAIERVDWNFGRIRETLEQLGLAEDTYIFFFSDHGDMHGSHGQFRKTLPWEESIRIPFLVGGPSREHQYPKREQALINHVDIAPTSLGICGIPVPSWMEGTDYSEVITTSAKAAERDYPDSAFMGIHVPTGNRNSIDRPWRGIVTKDGWKYAVLEGQPWLMFNLNEDPYEQANLVYNKEFDSQHKRLRDRLTMWLEKAGDDFH